MYCKLILIHSRVCNTIYPKEFSAWGMLKRYRKGISKALISQQLYLENIMECLVREVYQNLSFSLQVRVNSKSSECFRTSALLAKKLTELGFTNITLVRNEIQGSQHGFVVLRQDTCFWLIDPTYQQFHVSRCNCLLQPSVMVFPVKTLLDIESMLPVYGIHSEYSHYWKCEPLQVLLADTF